MRHRLTPLRSELERAATEYRETFATIVFEPARVREALSQASMRGHRSCMIRVFEPLDLRTTKAAEAILNWLKAEGLAFRWIERGLVAPAGGGEATWDLMIEWISPQL